MVLVWKGYPGWWKANISGSTEDPQPKLPRDVFRTLSVFTEWRRCVFLSQHELLYLDDLLDNGLQLENQNQSHVHSYSPRVILEA